MEKVIRNVTDYDISDSIWNRYLKEYSDKYLLERDEIGIWGIRLKQNLGCIQLYSIINNQLVAILNFRSQQHKTFFKRKLIGNAEIELKITQEGEDELCLMFYEKDIKKLESLFKISKKYKISKKEREKRIERLKLARKKKNGFGGIIVGQGD